jgi:hypothetical protein
MWVKNDVVDVVDELVLVVEVELVVVVLLVAVVVVVVDAGVVVPELELFSVVGSCCWTNGSLLWKLEYRSAGDTTIGCPPASATEATVVDTFA